MTLLSPSSCVPLWLCCNSASDKDHFEGILLWKSLTAAWVPRTLILSSSTLSALCLGHQLNYWKMASVRKGACNQLWPLVSVHSTQCLRGANEEDTQKLKDQEMTYSFRHVLGLVSIFNLKPFLRICGKNRFLFISLFTVIYLYSPSRSDLRRCAVLLAAMQH